MSPEIVIWVDEQDRELGGVPRSLVHNKMNLMLHRETMELLYKDSEHTQFLMQKRSPNKRQYGGLWTLSATCHVNTDDLSEEDPEGYLTAGKREAKEEIGVKAINQQLVAKRVIETGINKAMVGVIEGEYEGEPEIDPKEVSEVRLFTRETIGEIKDQLTPAALTCLVLLGILQEEEKKV
jgi:isopentenyldiphosphate isomerase